MDQERRNKQEVTAYRYKQSQAKYAQSRTGRFGAGLAKGLSFLKRGSVTRAAYRYSGQANPMQSSIGRRVKSGAGRPRGTVKYRDAQGNPIGVYEYRKLLAIRNAELRSKYARASALTPNQQIALQRLEAQRRYQQQNVEGRPIPDTYGQVDTAGIMNEIDFYSNMVG